MTIPYHVVIGGRCRGGEVEEVIESAFADIDRTVNDWNPASEVSRLNALPSGELLTLSPELASFLQDVGSVVEKTEGLFDPTIAPVHKRWHAQLELGAVPTQEELEELEIGWEKLHLEGNTIWKEGNIKLDLGGIAKGYAVDLIAQRLSAKGYRSFLVSWGGEIYAAGRHPSGRQWQVKRPDGIYPLEDEGLATSGDSEQYWVTPHGTYTHICHPKTRQALRIEHVGNHVSVTAPTCLEADGLATAELTNFLDWD